jgi:hypothetical protein
MGERKKEKFKIVVVVLQFLHCLVLQHDKFLVLPQRVNGVARISSLVAFPAKIRGCPVRRIGW